MSADPVVDISKVSFSFGGPTVIEDVSLQIADGEFIGLVGPNGGGKSTLIRLMSGMLKPTSGRVRVFGKEPDQASRQIGYVPQYPGFARDFPINVMQVVIMGRMGRLFGGYNQEDREIAQRAMRETEIEKLAKRSISTLSGGQLQRVLIARALACNPRMLLLDEPTANIDMRVENEIFDLLKRLNERMTVVVVSHDVGFISSYVTRVACLNRTLVCHETEALTGEAINALYGENVRHIAHNH